MFCKIGVTTRHISKRINEISSSIEFLNLISIKSIYTIQDTGSSILKLEQLLLSGPYKFIPSIKFVGYTEVLSQDSLNYIQNTIEKWQKHLKQ